jgi:hypothetical protein
MLRQPAHEDPHRLRRVEPVDAQLREDVHHARAPGRSPGSPTRRPPRPCSLELLLVLDDLGVAAEVAEVRAGRDRGLATSGG